MTFILCTFLSQEFRSLYPKSQVEQQSYLFLFLGNTLYVYKKNLFPTSCIDVFTFVTCLSFSRLI